MTKTRRVLCVDDHADTCALISLILADYEVTSALSKAEGLHVAKRQRFDLILLDYHLRDGSGPELSTQIRQSDPNIPILFVTGSHTMTMREALAAGAQGVVSKNDLADRLPRAVQEIFASTDHKESPDDELSVSTAYRCL